MTTVNTQISGLKGYDATQYATLTETAAAQNVDMSVVDSELLDAISEGKSFTEAVNIVTADLPELTEPKMTPTPADYYNCAGLPSPGAAMMAVMVENNAEERRDNAELRIQQTELIVDKMHSQAEEMRTKATRQLAMGVVSGVVNMVMGAISMGMACKTMHRADTEFDNFLQGTTKKGTITSKVGQQAKHNYDNMIMKQQSMTSTMGQMTSGATGIIDGLNQYFATMADAKIKPKNKLHKGIG